MTFFCPIGWEFLLESMEQRPRRQLNLFLLVPGTSKGIYQPGPQLGTWKNTKVQG